MTGQPASKQLAHVPLVRWRLGRDFVRHTKNIGRHSVLTLLQENLELVKERHWSAHEVKIIATYLKGFSK